MSCLWSIETELKRASKKARSAIERTGMLLDVLPPNSFRVLLQRCMHAGSCSASAVLVQPPEAEAATHKEKVVCVHRPSAQA